MACEEQKNGVFSKKSKILSAPMSQLERSGKKKTAQILSYEDSLLLLRNQSTGGNAKSKGNQKKPVSISTKLKEKEGRLSLLQRLKFQRPEEDDEQKKEGKTLDSANVGGKGRRMIMPKERLNLPKYERSNLPKSETEEEKSTGLMLAGPKKKEIVRVGKRPREAEVTDSEDELKKRRRLDHEQQRQEEVKKQKEYDELQKQKREEEAQKERESAELQKHKQEKKMQQEEEQEKMKKELFRKNILEADMADSEDDLRKRRRLHEQQLRIRRQEEIKKQREYDELLKQKREEEMKKERESAELREKMQQEEEQEKMKKELHAKILRKKLLEAARARSRKSLQDMEREAETNSYFVDNYKVMKDFVVLLNTPSTHQ